MICKNKRGNIPITILVIGVVAICILALGSFTFSAIKLNKDFNLKVFEDIYSDVEYFYFYKNQLGNEDLAALNINAVIEGDKLIIEREEEGIYVKYGFRVK